MTDRQRGHVEMTDSPDVYVAGCGIVDIRQLTKEAEAAIREAECVYMYYYNQAINNYVEAIASDVVFVTEEYDGDTHRGEIYRRIADRVVGGAESVDDPVTFLTYGHPFVFVTPTKFIVEAAEERGLDVRVMPGISAADCLFVDLRLDPAANGIQMFEATDLLLREFDLNPDVPALLWQVGAVETSFYSTDPSEPERFSRIREYLQQFYPDDHPVYLAKTAQFGFDESEILEYALDELESIHEVVSIAHTLYVPPVRERPVQNEELAEVVDSKDHLDEITRDEE